MAVLSGDFKIENVKFSRMINSLGRGCIGVYLVHNNRNTAHFMWEKLKINYWLVERGNLVIILLIAAAVFLICNLVDHIREAVFKLLSIDRVIAKISKSVCKRFEI